MRWEEEARNGVLLEIAKKWSNNKIMVRRLLMARKKTLLV